MKIKNYSEYVNEKLSNDEKYLLKNLPYVLGNGLISYLLGAAPLLSMKWDSLKDKSKGEYSYHGGTGHILVKRELTKIKLSDLPNTPLKRGLYPFFNKWNVYKCNDTPQGERTVFYISKDEIEKGDYIVSRRESDWEIEKNGDKKLRKATTSDPIFILVAKYDIDDFLHKDFIETFKDIMNSDIEDNGLSVENTHASIENNYLSCKISPKDGYDDLVISQDIMDILENNVKRVSEVLKSETKKEWYYSVSIYTGENTISVENKCKILDQYQQDSKFWDNLKVYSIYTEEDPKYLKKVYNKFRTDTLNSIFGDGQFRQIMIFNNSKKVIDRINLANQKFADINIHFTCRKNTTN